MGHNGRTGAGRIAIVGCGVGGPALCTLLARAGWDVTLFERAPVLRPIGAGLLIQPTGQAVLRELGVLDDVRRASSRVERLSGVTTSGRRVLDLDYATLSPGLHGLGVTRGALHRSLVGALQHSGATIRQGCEVRSLHEADGGVRVECAGESAPGPEFDAVAVCDGARSSLRPAGSPSRSYRWGALWTVLPDVDAQFAGVLSQVYRGTQRMVGFLPSGRPDAGGPAVVSIFWSVACAEMAALRAGPIADFAGAIVGLEPRAAGPLAHLHAWDQVITAEYFDANVRPSACGRVVYIGDAAHAMSPQLGQGANLALWDALRLAGALGRPGERDLVPALRAYGESRHDHAAFYRRASRALTPVFQSRLTPLAWARDALMPPLGRVPWIRRQMLLALAGVKVGVFREMDPVW